MIIDAHVHLMKAFDSKGNPQVYSLGKDGSAEEFVSLMDASGLDRAYFISWSPEDIPLDLISKNISVESVRDVMNREYAFEVLKKYPDRFYWFPCHLGPEIKDYLDIAQENFEMGASGIKFVCSFWGELPDDERLIPLYELAQKHRAAVMIDTSS
jgi:predicted TIM-barrel fold metal-dependent hydrolase